MVSAENNTARILSSMLTGPLRLLGYDSCIDQVGIFETRHSFYSSKKIIKIIVILF